MIRALRPHPLVLPLALPGLVGLSAACPPPEEVPEYIERATQVSIDPESEEFWALPFPDDLRRQEDGSFNLEQWPGNWDSETIVMWIRASDARLKGWGLSGGNFLQLSGAIDEGSLPSAESSLESDASVQLIDIDPDSDELGRRFPLDVRFLEQGDLYSPDNLLAIKPVFGFVRRPNTRYALVVTDALQDEDGEPVGATRSFFDHLFATGDPRAKASIHYSQLADVAKDIDIDLEHVAGAAVFTTMDHNQALLDLAAWGESLPAPELSSPWTVAQEYESYQVLTATFDVPQYQVGDRPYDGLGEGVIDYGDDGLPVVHGTQSVRLALTVPKAAQPAAGYPLTIYMHGSGGEWYQAINRSAKDEVPPEEQGPLYAGQGPSEWLARRGVATLGFDFPLHGNRNSPPDTTGLRFYNLFGNIEATLDNFNVAAVELTMLSRLMNTVTVDPALAATLDAGESPDGLIRFDPERLTAFGQSMGTTLGVNWATVDPRVKGLLFSGAGGILVDIAVNATEPTPLKGLLETLMGLDSDDDLHEHHPILHALQHVWDLADPVAKAPYVFDRPHPGIPPKHVMMTAGVTDGYFAPTSQAAMATALGVELVGEEVEPTLPDTLALDGRSTAPYPLRHNRGVTAGVVHFEAPYTLGHYVVFNQDGARHQYTCFLASVGTDEGARIAEAAGLDDPCP